MASHDLELQLKGYGLTTAEILYRMPDHPDLLQTFIWQHYDLAPKFPVLTKFLLWWGKELAGPLHEVRVSHSKLVSPAEFRAVEGILNLH